MPHARQPCWQLQRSLTPFRHCGLHVLWIGFSTPQEHHKEGDSKKKLSHTEGLSEAKTRVLPMGKLALRVHGGATSCLNLGRECSWIHASVGAVWVGVGRQLLFSSAWEKVF